MSFVIRVILTLFVLISLISCQTLPIEKEDSSAQNYRIQSLIIHFTAVDFRKSMWALKNSGQVSSHYLIPESMDESYKFNDLKVIQLVEEENRAWHAGDSWWQGRDNLNDTSIGIEIVNQPACHGRDTVEKRPEFGSHQACRFPDFDPKQIDLLIKLIKSIMQRHPGIEPTGILGHSDVATARKGDPGPRFPWYLLYKNGIGAWYDDDTKTLYQDLFELTEPSVELIQRALRIYGYKIKVTGELDQQTQDVLYAFQTHFVPWELTSLPSISTTAALFALIDKYHADAAERLFKRYASTFFGPEKSVIKNTSKTVFHRFYGLKGKGELIISSELPSDAVVRVNGHLVDLKKSKSKLKGVRQINISHLTKDGKNVMELIGIPYDKGLIRIAQPVLNHKIKTSKFNRSKALDRAISNEIVIHESQRYQSQQDGDVRLEFVGEHIATLLAINALLDQGLVNKQDKLVSYLPEYVQAGREYRTIAHLISHRSGYGPSLIHESPLEPIERDLTKWQYRDRNIRIKQALVEKEPYVHGLNTQKQFSSINDRLLGYLVERISGMSLSEYLKLNVFEPLGLTSTYLKLENKGVTDAQLLPYQLITTSHELSVLLQLLLNDGGYGQTSIWQMPLMNDTYGSRKDVFQCLPYLSDQLWYIESGYELIVVDATKHLALFRKTKLSDKAKLINCEISDSSADWLTELYQSLN